MKKNVLLLILICGSAFGADVKWTAISELTAINDADILVVVDDVAGTPISKKITVLNFFDTIDSSSKLRAIVGDETGTGLLVFGTAPTFTTSITITGANADPAAAGEIRYDNTITGIMSGGALRWYDDNSVRLLVDLETDPSNDDYVVAYDSTADGFYMKADADTGGSTKWNAIGDADGVGSIDFVTYTQTIDIGITDTGGPKDGLILTATGLGAGTTDVRVLKITTTANDDADYVPITIYDDSGGTPDLLFSIDSTGTIQTGIWDAGAITSSGTVEGSALTEGGKAVLLADGSRALAGAWSMGNQATTNVNIDSGVITGITDLVVADGGTGASTLTDGGILLGSGTGAITALGVATNGQIPIGDGATDPVLATISGGTSITVTNGAGTISIAVDDDFLKLGGDVATAGTYDFGSANVVLEIPNAAAPTTDATGEMAIDTNLITQGMLQVYLASAIANVVATTDTPGDNEVPTYDAAGGTVQWEAGGGGGATAWDDIADPDNSGLTTITFDNAELSLLTGNNDAAASFFTIQNTDADHTGGNLYLLDLDYSADDGDVDADFIKFQDSGSVVMTIQQNGDITTDGGLVAGGAITEGGNAVPNATDHLGFFGGTTSAELFGELSDETGSAAGSPLAVFNTAPVFVTSIQLTGADADPAAAAGTIAYDSTISGMSGGGIRWYDNNSVRLIVDLETDPSNDDYIVTYDADADGFYMKADADTGGSTKWNAIGDADGVGSIDFVTFTQTIDIGVTDTGGPKSGLILDVTGLGVGTTDVIALEITTATDDDLDYVPIAIYDDSGANNDLLFRIDEDGDVWTAGSYLFIADNGEISNEGNVIKFADNSDTFKMSFGGTDVDLLWSDGALNLRNEEDGIDAIVEIEGKDAGEKGILRVLSDGDDKYVEFYHDDTDAQIVSSSGDLIITPAGDDLLVDAGLTVGSSTEAGDNNLRVEGTSTLVGVIENASNIKSNPKHLIFTIINPLATQTEDNEICLWKAVPAALTVTKIEVTLDASGNEVAGDLKWADAFIGLANATVINVFDTSSGVLVDSTITAGSVASGKCIYLAFDSAPNTAITQMSVDITFDYD